MEKNNFILEKIFYHVHLLAQFCISKEAMFDDSGVKVHGAFLHEWEEHAREHQKSVL